MNLFSCLFPCALQQSWWGAGSEQCMSEEFVHRMGVNASSAGGDAGGGCQGQVSLSEPPTPMYRDMMGVIVRERKKKATGFATLKKKFIRRRRSSKACDHGRMLRELVSDWSAADVAALLEEYEALAALKDLCVQAELARPPAATFKQDLSALYDYKYCTDADLVYRGACFPVHRALLSARCPYFRDLLTGCPGYGARICLELRTATVDVQLFSALLRYLYTGDICPHDTNIDMNLLRRLREEFGTPNPLETDLRYLLETGDYADAALVFTSDGSDCQRPDSGSSEYGFRPKLELPCHKAILSARSPFFRSLLQRRSRTGEDHTERALHIPTRIVLDESVIPKRYKHQATIIPILVGSLSPEKEACYGRILSSYLADPQNLFVISSDFCHWGQRFRYTYYDRSYETIYQSIEGLDKAGMNIIENLNPTEFNNYIKKYGNTICGRHPIGILLQAVQELLRNDSSQNASLKFLKYAQSSQCRNMNDSSVSYASAALVFE